MTKPPLPGLGNFSSKDFLRARRPEAFSDSWSEDENRLDRSLLEYHLDTITNRSQEVRFEEFARALAEKEVCPIWLHRPAQPWRRQQGGYGKARRAYSGA